MTDAPAGTPGERPDAAELKTMISFLQQQIADRENYGDVVGRADYADLLVRAHGTYLDRETFRPGDLVQWKTHMRNRNYPAYGAPAVVVRYLDEPRTRDSKGVTLTEPLDIVLGVLDGDLDFRLFTFASSRFTRY